MKVEGVMRETVIPGEDAPDRTVMRINFQRDDEELGGNARQVEAIEFAGWWRDRFGTIHFVLVPDDGRWQQWFERERDDDSQWAQDRTGDAGKPFTRDDDE